MEKLEKECIKFFHDNINDILKGKFPILLLKNKIYILNYVLKLLSIYLHNTKYI